uniref:Cysteine-rich motor neuron 1 protein n=1 Tax=Ciona savignyi TaxID=51511 RepID=H2YAQ5_CIOSA
ILRTMFREYHLLTLALLCVFSGFVDGLSCRACNPSRCELKDPASCPGGTVRDACECCMECAKLEGEECGGIFGIKGQCDAHLSCIIQPNNGDPLDGNVAGVCKGKPTTSLTASDHCHQRTFEGCNLTGRKCVCRRQLACKNPYRFTSADSCRRHTHRKIIIHCLRSSCSDVTCDIKHSPRCPEDSEIVEGYVPPGQCCPTASRCECKLENCAYHLCSSDEEMHPVRRGNGVPGSCCDEYECRPRESPIDECAAVRCALYPLTSVTCPSDSVAVRDPNPSSQCCPGDPISLPFRCQCKPCTQPTCGRNKKAQVTFRADGKPGSCCDEYKCSNETGNAGCSVNGTRHPHGTTYKREECRVCECQNGVSYCERQQCPTRTCTRLVMKQGACCPECDEGKAGPKGRIGECFYIDGQSAYSVGETWSPDPCTKCRCAERGERICEAAFCYGYANLSPIIQPGKYCISEASTVTMAVPACPSMDGCSLTDEDCRGGFMKDRNNCRMCKCISGEGNCPSMTKCALKCARGFQRDDSGCETCACLQRPRKCKELTACIKQCPYGYRLNKKGCDRCKCRRCQPMDSCDKECTFGLSVNNYGCDICKCKGSAIALPSPEKAATHSCADDSIDRRRDDGETWSSDCFICVCRGGDVMCDAIKCPVPACENPVLREGDCCASCAGNLQKPNPESSSLVPQSLSCQEPGGNWFVEGETWKVSECTSCICHSGLVMCTSFKCPATNCMHPVLHPGECCPKCPAFAGSLNIASLGPSCKLDSGKMFKSGDSWKSDPCTSHACLGGAIQNFSVQCPQNHGCVSPVRMRDQCCPTCLGSAARHKNCNANETVYRDGELWNDADKPCVKCRCVDGDIQCYHPMCDPLPSNCPTVFRREGACCDEC